MKRTAFWFAPALCMVLLTGCMNSAGKPETTVPTAAPAAPAATATASATETAGAAGGVLGENTAETAAPAQQGSASTGFDWTSRTAEIEERINQISEISESRLIVNDNTALVAVKFASNYQGELTERIREMVAAVIMEADPSITTVAVTAEEADVNTVGDIADKIANGTALDDLKTEIEKIVRNATTMR